MENNEAIIIAYKWVFVRCEKYKSREHTAGSDTIFIQIYMDPPPGVPGVSKNKTVEFLH